jgi:DNA invertase Pin-like site-specific DNA recombinase
VKDLDRPELVRALTALTAGSVLVILKLNRLTRVVSHLAPLLEPIEGAGADTVTVHEHYDASTATGWLMLRLMLELFHWEREVIGERTAAALMEKRKRRERLGTTPLGDRTDADRVVHVVAEEMATVHRTGAAGAREDAAPGRGHARRRRAQDEKGRRLERGHRRKVRRPALSGNAGRATTAAIRMARLLAAS